MLVSQPPITGRFAFWILLLLISACETETFTFKHSDIELGNVKTVLILGNSITVTRPAPEIGWNANWGMAATSEANDYVHLLIERFHKHNDSIDVRYASVSGFERQFRNYDYSQLDEFHALAPDVIVIRLGENVDDEEAGRHQFQNQLQQLINYIKGNRPTIVVCTSTFWPKNSTNLQIKALCDSQKYIFVPITDLFKDKANTAKGQFADPEVQVHPSDKGMRYIAARIAQALGLPE